MGTVRQRGDTWQAQVRIKQGGEVVHAESKSFPSEKLALAWAERVEADIAKRGVGQRKVRTATVAELIEKYREKREEIKPLRRRLIHEMDQLTAAFGSLRLTEEDLTSERVINWAIGRRKECGPATVLHNLSTFRSVLNAAKPMFRLEVNGDCVNDAIDVLARDQVVAKSQQRERRCSVDEEAALVKEFTRVKGLPTTEIPMHIIVPLAIRLPRRVGELCAMTWADYNASTGVQVLRDTKNPKAPRIERVPVPAAARAIYKTLPTIDARVLPYVSESVSAAFKRCCQRLGIENLTFHDLRHEGITRLFEQGLSIQKVALISGHLAWSTLKRYTHLQPEDVAKEAA